MLTLRDCFSIATLFAVTFAWLKLDPGNAAHFLFVPSAFAVWLFCARSRSLASPLARIALAGVAGAVSEVVLVLLFALIARYNAFLAYPENLLGVAVVVLSGFGLCGGLLLGLMAEVFSPFCQPRRKKLRAIEADAKG